MNLDANFLDSLLRGEAIVLASRISDKQRIARQLREHIERERQKLFMQETIDDHLRREYGPGVIRLDLVKIPTQFSYADYQEQVWRLAMQQFRLAAREKGDVSAQAHEERQQSRLSL